jgi:hypothetical protein
MPYLTIASLKKKYDFPAMFAKSGKPIITVMQFSKSQPRFASVSKDKLKDTIDKWVAVADCVTCDSPDDGPEVKERAQQIRSDIEAALEIFDPAQQRMIIKFDLYNFEMCVE